jgi:hypothetical protein
MIDQQSEAKRRAIGYWFADGLPELAFGGVLVATAAVCGAAGLASGETSGIVLAVGLPVVLFLGIPLAGRWVRHVKRSSTYPRTGRVAYRSRSARRRIVSGVVALALVAILGWLLWRAESEELTAILVTAGITASLLTVALRAGLHRFTAAAVIAVVALVATGGLLPDAPAVIGTVLGITGLFVLRNGWAARTRYMREAPEPVDVEEGP